MCIYIYIYTYIHIRAYTCMMIRRVWKPMPISIRLRSKEFARRKFVRHAAMLQSDARIVQLTVQNYPSHVIGSLNRQV